MHKFLFCLLFGLAGCFLSAQTLVSTSGGHFTSNTAQMSWSLGEISISDYAAASFSYTEGLHQPALPDSSVSLNETMPLRWSVFPNPVEQKLFIEASGPSRLTNLTLTNTAGQLVMSREFLEDQNILDLSALPAGVYFLAVYTLRGFSTTYKILKK